MKKVDEKAWNELRAALNRFVKPSVKSSVKSSRKKENGS